MPAGWQRGGVRMRPCVLPRRRAQATCYALTRSCTLGTRQPDTMPITMGNGAGTTVLVCGAGGFIGVSLHLSLARSLALSVARSLALKSVILFRDSGPSTLPLRSPAHQTH